MDKNFFYKKLIEEFKEVIPDTGILNDEVLVKAKVLSTVEALGNPDRKDFPLLTGKEKLMEADYKGYKGQAYTDQPGIFQGTIGSIIEKLPENNFERALLVSTINAVCAYFGITDRTIHCKDNEPELCASKLTEFIKEKFGNPRIALVGYQPSMLEKLSEVFPVRNLDLDADKIGQIKYGVKVEHGVKQKDEVLQWSDIILATGSTIANGTIINYMDTKPVFFYGTTISGAASLMNLNRYCACAK
jgi:hypothetical protein